MTTWEDRLTADEKELLAHLRDSRTKWPTLYLCLRRMQDKNVFQGSSFSRWLHGFCYYAGCGESRLWDAQRAGKFYEEWAATRPDVPKIEQLDVDPQNLIVIQRIVKLDPSQKETLMMKLLKKQVKRRDLLEEASRLSLKAQQERQVIKGSNLPWREMNLRDAPYAREYRSLLEILDMYYNNTTIDGCRHVVDELKVCVDKVRKSQIEHEEYKVEQ